MSSSFELVSVPAPQPQYVSQSQRYPEPKSRTNFWLLITVIGLIILLIVLVIIFVFAPVSNMNADVNDITSKVDELSPKVDKAITDGEATLKLVDSFISTAGDDLDNAILDICSGPFRSEFPTLCKVTLLPGGNSNNNGTTTGNSLGGTVGDRIAAMNGNNGVSNAALKNGNAGVNDMNGGSDGCRCSHQCDHDSEDVFDKGYGYGHERGFDQGYGYGHERGFDQGLTFGQNQGFSYGRDCSHDDYESDQDECCQHHGEYYNFEPTQEDDEDHEHSHDDGEVHQHEYDEYDEYSEEDDQDDQEVFLQAEDEDSVGLEE